MADQHRTDEQSIERDALDRELDAVLARYSGVEPRAGLETRILARLRAEEERPRVHAWWRWSVAAAMAAVVVIAVALIWRSARQSHSVAIRTSITTAGPKTPEAAVTANPASSVAHQQAPTRRPGTHRAPAVTAPAAPKLDQFPSPQPLSEQEKVLAGYVDKFSARAALLAEARMDSLRRDEEERRQIAAGSQDSQQ